LVEIANVSIMSRCAPASDAPITARSSCHTAARACQSASVSPALCGANEVLSPSAIARSRNASKGALPSASAISPIVLPARSWFRSENASTTRMFCQFARNLSMPAASECAPSSRYFR
jgi:hypothetical protein